MGTFPEVHWQTDSGEESGRLKGLRMDGKLIIGYDHEDGGESHLYFEWSRLKESTDEIRKLLMVSPTIAQNVELDIDQTVEEKIEDPHQQTSQILFSGKKNNKWYAYDTRKREVDGPFKRHKDLKQKYNVNKVKGVGDGKYVLFGDDNRLYLPLE